MHAHLKKGLTVYLLRKRLGCPDMDREVLQRLALWMR